MTTAPLPVTTLCEAFQRTAARHPDRVALRTPGGAVSITWRQYAARVQTLASALAARGVGRGDSVAIMMTNRPEMHLVDVAAMHLGATAFSIYNTLATDQIVHVLSNSGAKVVAFERQFADRLVPAAQQTGADTLVSVDGPHVGAITLEELESQGDPSFDFDASWRAVKPDDVLTLIYTSGTTGDPKGVELTHANMLAELNGGNIDMEVTADDRVVTYLPHAHVADRWGSHYSQVAFGTQLTCVSDTKQILAALTDARPTMFGAVPQIWYKVQTGIETKVANEPSPVKKRLADWAIATSVAAVEAKVKTGSVPPVLAFKQKLADRLVLSKIREGIGLDHVRIAVSGAAAITQETLVLMTALGLPICEAWGMSELSGIATINPPNAQRLGTVGKAVNGVELRLADDGELLVRGPIVMKGYRNEPGKTAEAIDDDGWLHTGDIATIDADGYVTIVDRKKELLINAAGKNMSPTNIESAIRAASPLVGQAVAIGDRRKYNVALIVLEPEATATFAAQHDLADASVAVLAQDPAVRAEIQRAIDGANGRLARVEQIKRFAILPDAWEPGSTELTPTMKLRRKPISERYTDVIEGLYVDDRVAGTTR
ncbi:MAG: long-chain fatty acid--CoA ligase [Patulibacter sp.]|nr:long-chain fatty acid--CoA ligase [Patulibacter sp.]